MPVPRSLKLDQPPHERDWLIPGLLPRGEIVFLDGLIGIGKSCLIAACVSTLSHSPILKDNETILYITSPRQRELIKTFLHRQQPNYDKLRNVEFTMDSSVSLEQVSRSSLLLEFLISEGQNHHPAMIVLDSFEELVGKDSRLNAEDWTLFWETLQQMAATFHCTILIPRRHGYHENRQYGHDVRVGSEVTRFALAMQFHPTDPLKRIITVAKNQTGPIGGQTLAQFIGNKMEITGLEAPEHVRPSRNVTTWQNNDAHKKQENAEIMEAVDCCMGGHPMLKKMVKEFVMRNGFSERAYDRAMAEAKLPIKKFGDEWAYLPNEAMLQRHGQQKQLEKDTLQNPMNTPRAHGAAVVEPAPRRAG
ncbi:MAG: AAA family ATPase [Gemmatales bacterium]